MYFLNYRPTTEWAVGIGCNDKNRYILFFRKSKFSLHKIYYTKLIILNADTKATLSDALYLCKLIRFKQ